MALQSRSHGRSKIVFGGRPAADPRDAQIARLQKEKAKLEQELATARFVVDVQSKLQALSETISEGADTEPGPTS